MLKITAVAIQNINGKLLWENKWLLTDIPHITPTARYEHTVTETMRNPEELFDQPSYYNPKDLIDRCHKNERS